MIFVLIMTLVGLYSISASADIEGAYEHLVEVMDLYNTFEVYTDQDAGGNHYFPSGWMGDIEAITSDTNWQDNPHFGLTCIKLSFIARNNNWAGIYWLNPENNWSDPGGGYDLTGATKLTFWARGEKGGESVEFFVGGITGVDSIPKQSTGYRTLTSEWQQIEIKLPGHLNLHSIVGGFGWVTNQAHNPNGATFYLDQIQYDLSRPDEPRFLRSYTPVSRNDPDRVLTNVGFTYDQASAAIGFMARGSDDDWRRAKLILDAFLFAQANDRYYTDGRLRNAYMTGDIVDHSHEIGKVRMPGWWDFEADQWFEDLFQVSSHTGNQAWVILALLSYYEERGGGQYLQAALNLGNWIFNHTYDTRGPGGYTSGYEGWEPNPTKIWTKSTEMNIDIYVAFSRLHQITGDPVWRDRALHAKHFVEAMWNESEGHFWIGTTEDGETPWIHPPAQPIDTNTWGLLALRNSTYARGIEWVEANAAVSVDGVSGWDFNTDKDGIWTEGSGQMCLALQFLNQEDKVAQCLQQLRDIQTLTTIMNADGKGLVAAIPDGITTGLSSRIVDENGEIQEIPWLYFTRLHVAAVAWYLFAEHGYDPFWNQTVIPFQKISVSVPLQGYAGDCASLFFQIAQGGSILHEFWSVLPYSSDPGQHPQSPYEMELPSGVHLSLGTYDISVKGYHHLRKIVTGVTVAEGSSPPVVFDPLCGGDANNDNQITFLGDVSIIVAAFGKCHDKPCDYYGQDGNPPIEWQADFNGDGCVTFLGDVSLIVACFGKIGDELPIAAAPGRKLIPQFGVNASAQLQMRTK